jgi:hypothetical protein
MALTKGFKKFVGLVVVVGAVAGSIVGYKMYAKAHPPAPVDPGIDVSSGTSDAGASSVNYALPASQQEAPATSQPVEQAPQAAAPAQDAAPSNSGMAALLKAGQK